jgi:hypothetical protein
MSRASDYQIRTYVDKVFQRYDKDRSGNLNPNEFVLFFNELFKLFGN